MKFNEKIKNIRTENNLTQEQLANKLFVSRSAVAKWEQGRGLPSIELLNKICETFNISMDELISEDDIKQITINTNTITNKNSSHIKLSLIIGSILLLILSIILLYVLIINNEEEIVYTDEYNITGKVIGIDDEYLNIKTNVGNEAFEISNLYNCTVLDRSGEIIDINDIKENYFLSITYIHLMVKDKIKSKRINKISIIEDYLSDRMVYGWFIRTDKTVEPSECPIYNPSLNSAFNNNKYEKQAYHITESLGVNYSFYYPYYYTTGNRDSSNYNVDYCDNIFNIISARENQKSNYNIIKCDINIDDSVNYVYLYCIDNSETGFSLYKTITKNDNKVEFEIVTYNIDCKNLSESNNYNIPYSKIEKYEMHFNFIDSVDQVNLYTYEDKDILLYEKNYQYYEDCVSKGTIISYGLYDVIVEEKNNDEIISTDVNNSVYTFKIKTYYGYIIETSFIINLKSRE